MSIIDKFKSMPRVSLIGFFAPFVVLVCIFIAIGLSPTFVWADNALSDLGHYTRTDIGPNPALRAIIFNAGLIVTGLMMLIFTIPLVRKLSRPLPKLGMGIFIIAELFLIAIGIFTETPPTGEIHYLASVGFFLTFPFAMWFLGIDWLWRRKQIMFSLVSIILPFVSILFWYQYFFAPIWIGQAIPEIVTAVTAIVWIWWINLFDIRGQFINGEASHSIEPE